MRNLALQPRRRVLHQPAPCHGPEDGVRVVLDDDIVLDLAPDAAHEAVLGFRAAVGLRFIESFLVNFVFELGGDGGALEDFVLAVREVAFEAVLAERDCQTSISVWPAAWEVAVAVAVRCCMPYT